MADVGRAPKHATELRRNVAELGGLEPHPDHVGMDLALFVVGADERHERRAIVRCELNIVRPSRFWLREDHESSARQNGQRCGDGEPPDGL